MFTGMFMFMFMIQKWQTLALQSCAGLRPASESHVIVSVLVQEIKHFLESMTSLSDVVFNDVFTFGCTGVYV